MDQKQLSPGSSDKTNDCMRCSAYTPNGEGVFYCRYEGEWDVNKCEKCGHCNAFRPITDEDVESWLSLDFDNGHIKKTSFNRYKWIEVEKL